MRSCRLGCSFPDFPNRLCLRAISRDWLNIIDLMIGVKNGRGMPRKRKFAEQSRGCYKITAELRATCLEDPVWKTSLWDELAVREASQSLLPLAHRFAAFFFRSFFVFFPTAWLLLSRTSVTSGRASGCRVLGRDARTMDAGESMTLLGKNRKLRKAKGRDG